MRFVRAFLDTSGAPVAVVESELPIGADYIRNGVALEHADLGVMLDFDPVDLQGAPVTAAEALRLRIEKHPLAGTHPDAPRCRIAPGHLDLPELHFCPASETDIAAHLRARGPDGIPLIAQAWLVRILPPEKVRALGLSASVSVAMLKALEANRRGLIDGGRLAQFERGVQAVSDARSARTLALRQAQQTAAANAAWAEMVEAIEGDQPTDAPPETPQETP